MAKNNQQLSETRRNDADEMALALGFRSKKDPSRGSHRALETEMLRRWRNGDVVALSFVGSGPAVVISAIRDASDSAGEQ